METLVFTEGWLHRESMGQLRLFLPPVAPSGHVCVGHRPSLAMFSVLSPSVGEGQDGLLLWGCQGTAGEVTHSQSPRGTGLGTGLGGWRNQGPGAHGPSHSLFPNLADVTWQVAESWRLQAGQMSGERCGAPWGCLVTQEERLQGVGLAPWPLGPELSPGLVGSFPLGGARSQASGLSLGVSKHYPLLVPRKVWSKPALPSFTRLKSRTSDCLV